MIILRKGTIGNFYYEDINGDKIKDPTIMQYLNELKIPPAYNEVEIFYVKNPKILFQGKDAAGRLQQIYSLSHCKNACKKKFKELVEFGKVLPKIYQDCDKYMKSDKLTRNKIISIVIKIISLCYFRIGNLKYVKLYDHYGISTIRVKHIIKQKNEYHIKFTGKKGVINECVISDPLINKNIAELLKNKSPNDHVFAYKEHNEYVVISSQEINEWLRKYGPNISTKMFRNFDANLLFLDYIKQEHSQHDISIDKITLIKRKKILVAAMKYVSDEINNTPSICKKAYMSPELIELYLNKPRKFKTLFLNGASSRISFINFLKTTYM